MRIEMLKEKLAIDAWLDQSARRQSKLFTVMGRCNSFLIVAEMVVQRQLARQKFVAGLASKVALFDQAFGN